MTENYSEVCKVGGSLIAFLRLVVWQAAQSFTSGFALVPETTSSRELKLREHFRLSHCHKVSIEIGVSSPLSILFRWSNDEMFVSGSLFDRIFPLSPLERFKNTSLRHMSSCHAGCPPNGVVRNIPIKVEGVSIYIRCCADKISSIQANFNFRFISVITKHLDKRSHLTW